MPIKAIVVTAFASLVLFASAMPSHAQNLIPETSADLYPLGLTMYGMQGVPRSNARLFVKLEVVPTCTVDVAGSVSIRCTRGVPYRAWILNDTNAAFHRIQVSDAHSEAGSNELVRIEAQRLDVEF